jgi:hypothetical protein
MSQSVSVIIIEKQGTEKILNIKKFAKEELFKKCGFKKSEDFILINNWETNDDYIIELYGKTSGKQNNININEFTQYANLPQLYGNALLTMRNKNELTEYISLNLEYWNKFKENIRPKSINTVQLEEIKQLNISNIKIAKEVVEDIAQSTPILTTNENENSTTKPTTKSIEKTQITVNSAVKKQEKPVKQVKMELTEVEEEEENIIQSISHKVSSSKSSKSKSNIQKKQQNIPLVRKELTEEPYIEE